MNKSCFFWLCNLIVATVLSSAVLWAAPPEKSLDNLVVPELRFDAPSARPGGTFRAGVLFTLKDHWHIYWKQPGDAGLPTVISWQVSSAARVGAQEWPVPQKFVLPGNIVNYGYESKVLLWVPVQVPKDLGTTKEVKVSAELKWLACSDVCVPGSGKVEGSIPLEGGATLDPGTRGVGGSANAALFDKFEKLVPPRYDFSRMSEMPFEAQLQGSLVNPTTPNPITIELLWRNAVKELDWFPGHDRALEVRNVAFNKQGLRTTIHFDTLVKPGKSFTGTEMDSVVVWRDKDGNGGFFSLPIALSGPSPSPVP